MSDLKNDIHITKYSLLIAEDNADLQAALAQEATEKGFKVYLSADGVDAVRKAQMQTFDAILFDMNLPKKQGHEAVDEIRRSGLSRDAVIVVLSGYLKKEVVQFLAGKIEKAFTKPAEIDIVIETLEGLIEQKRKKEAG